MPQLEVLELRQEQKRPHFAFPLTSNSFLYQEKEHKLQLSVQVVREDSVYKQSKREDKVLPVGLYLAKEPLLRLFPQKVLYVISEIELSSMEDIIPVLIIVVLMLEIGGLRSELDIMVDFISYDPNEMEAEKRLLINISVMDELCRNRTTTSSGIGLLRNDINPLC